jgi:HK97 family phage portal protein
MATVSWLDRFRAAVGRRGRAASPVQPAATLPGRGVRVLRLAEPIRQAKASYLDVATHPLVEACIEAIATVAASARPTLRIAGQPVEQHPILDLIWHPTPDIDYATLLRTWVAQERLVGRIFSELVLRGDGTPAYILPRPSSVVQERYSATGALEAIEYGEPGTGRPKTMVPGTYLWAIVPSTDDPLVPRARWTMIASEVALDRALMGYVSDVARSGLRQIVLTTRDDLDDEEAEAVRMRVEAALKRDSSGRQAGIPLLQQSRVDVREVGVSPQEIDVADLLAHVEARICSVLGVPPIMVSAVIGLKRATYANYREARQHLVHDVIIPFVGRIGQMLETQLAPLYGLDPSQVELVWDFSELAGADEHRATQWQLAERGWNAGLLTRNEARSMMGLPRVADGDVLKSGLSDLTEPTQVEAEP